MSKAIKISDETYEMLDKYCGEVKKKSAVASIAIQKYLRSKERGEVRDDDR